jgi:hypothetical protein
MSLKLGLYVRVFGATHSVTGTVQCERLRDEYNLVSKLPIAPIERWTGRCWESTGMVFNWNRG